MYKQFLTIFGKWQQSGMNNIGTPFARPLYVISKPAGASCNLACKYCYYLEKKSLYGETPQSRSFIMTDDILEKFVKMYIESQSSPEILFCWHGGESLMRPISFYEKAIRFQQKYGRGLIIDNSIQTNATLLTDDWCRFFKKNNWLVGVSVDGPQEFHDEYRRNRLGAPSFAKVMNGIDLLHKHSVEWNAMAVVNDFNADFPVEFYRFFKDIGCRFLQFTPILERIKPGSGGNRFASPSEANRLPLADFSVTPEQWGGFLCGVFDEWVCNDVGEIFVQLFDATLANWTGEEPGVCSLGKTCGHALVIEYNGDVYSCDHFVFPEYKLGNIGNMTLVEMALSEMQQKFGMAKTGSLPSECKQCRYLFACNGECPKNRFAVTAAGEYGLNYLCRGYYKFFEHVAPYMEFMARELENSRPPSNVMQFARSRHVE